MLRGHGLLGLALVGTAWPVSWLQISPLGQFAFFPLWLGYILVVDAVLLWRTGSSLLTRHPRVFVVMFFVSMPMWWVFEGTNHFTQNWHYHGVGEYNSLQYVLLASWHFSIVVPAVFETAALVGTLQPIQRLARRSTLASGARTRAVCVFLGVVSLGALLVWPTYFFPLTWLALFLVLDPINDALGRPSVLASLRRGDWRIVTAFGLGALVCGLFWEMWNYWAMPKWSYRIPFVEAFHIFEMPLLGYAGYLPFGLEVFAFYYFLTPRPLHVAALERVSFGRRA